MYKTLEEAKEIIENMGSNDNEVTHDRTPIVLQKKGVLELDHTKA